MAGLQERGVTRTLTEGERGHFKAKSREQGDGTQGLAGKARACAWLEGGGVARHTSRQSQVLSGNGPDRQDVALRAVEAQEQPWPTAQRLGQRAGPARRVKLMERGLHTRLEA